MISNYNHFKVEYIEYAPQGRLRPALVVVGIVGRLSDLVDSDSFVSSTLLKELIGIMWGGLTSRGNFRDSEQVS